MVIIDEAHHVRRTYQGRNRFTPTNLYRLGEQLADPDLGRAQSMLFLTATPMQLHRFELYSLIELLDPALFPTFADFERHVGELRGLNETVEGIKRWPALAGAEREETLERAGEWLGDDVDELEREVTEAPARTIERLEDQHRLSKVMVRNRK